jgi:cystathionine gamma-lyase
MTAHPDFAPNGQNSESQKRQFATLAVHAGAPHDPTTGAVIAPVSFATPISNAIVVTQR